MSDLDLSFVAKKGDFEKPVANGALDLSFADSPKLTAAQTAERIISDQDKGRFPKGARNERGVWDKAGDVITGNDRQTNATRNLPELGTEIGLGEFLGMDTRVGLGDVRGLPVSAAALTTTDPVEMVKILQEKAGDRLSVRPDEAGNIIVGLDGREAVLNKPGFTPFDAMQLGGFMAAFTPASKAATAPKTLGNQLGRWAIHLDFPVIQISQYTGATRQTIYNWFSGTDVTPAYRDRVKSLLNILQTSTTAEEALRKCAHK